MICVFRGLKNVQAKNSSTDLALARNWNLILCDNVFWSLAGSVDSFSDRGAD